MKKRLSLFYAFILVLFIAVCSEANTKEKNSMGRDKKIRVTIDDTTLTATMYDNPTTRSFIEKLPITLPMHDLYSREIVYRFPEVLPAKEVTKRGYEVGEIIYYPPLHSFVIMYAQSNEKFDMQSMGRIDSNIEVLKGIGNTDVRFELIDNQEADEMKIKITFGEKELTATIYDNATAKDFMTLLPLSLTLEDYAGTEKISYLPKKLSLKDMPEGCDPSIGDVTYYSPWGNLAIFYKDANYASGLMKIGKVDSNIKLLENLKDSQEIKIESITYK